MSDVALFDALVGSRQQVSSFAEILHERNERSVFGEVEVHQLVRPFFRQQQEHLLGLVVEDVVEGVVEHQLEDDGLELALREDRLVEGSRVGVVALD